MNKYNEKTLHYLFNNSLTNSIFLINDDTYIPDYWTYPRHQPPDSEPCLFNLFEYAHLTGEYLFSDDYGKLKVKKIDGETTWYEYIYYIYFSEFDRGMYLTKIEDDFVIQQSLKPRMLRGYLEDTKESRNESE